jgi:UDP-hydrolysing UDP-N-acetyl-D-glucosamine 2-epimerase
MDGVVARRDRTIAVATTGRSDYGLIRPVFRALAATAGIRARLLITGSHIAADTGALAHEITNDGFDRDAIRINMEMRGDTPLHAAAAMGAGLQRAAEAFARERPDILVVLGDRFETLAIVAATVPFGLPVAHIHGGEITEGHMDDATRHAITKLSHLHFVSNSAHADRVRQLGEERWRVVVSGAPGLDELRDFRPLDADVIAQRIGMPVDDDTIVVTHHPEAGPPETTERHLREVIKAIDILDRPVIFTAPNADPGHSRVRDAITRAADAPQRVFVENLGHELYFSVMANAGVMVGNSSSGLIEAPSFQLPVVNVGDRQRGRLRARNVIDVAPRAGAIVAGVRRASSAAFRRSLRGLRNPYGAGRASQRIAATLARVSIDRLSKKRFVDR